MDNLVVFPSQSNVTTLPSYQSIFHDHVVKAETRSVHDVLVERGMNWEVKEKPVHLEVSPLVYEVIPNQKAIVRADTYESLGIVKDRFTPIQNEEAFSVLTPLIEGGYAKITSAGVFYGGAQVWMEIEFDHSNIPFWEQLMNELDDPIIARALMYDHKAGTGSTFLASILHRFWCANQLQSIRNNSNLVKSKHVGNAQKRIEQRAEAMFAQYLRVTEYIAANFIKLHNTKLTADEYIVLVLAEIAPDPNDIARDDYSSHNRYVGAKNKAARKRNSVARLWSEGSHHKGDYSSWEALNGAIEAIDHDPDSVFSKKKPLLSAISGPQAQIKDKITSNLINHALVA